MEEASERLVIEQFYDSHDWIEELRKKDGELKKLNLKLLDRDKKIKNLENQLEDLRYDYSRIKSRMEWLEKKEDEERKWERAKRAKRQREEEMKEEIRMKVRIEEEERAKIRRKFIESSSKKIR